MRFDHYLHSVNDNKILDLLYLILKEQRKMASDIDNATAAILTAVGDAVAEIQALAASIAANAGNATATAADAAKINAAAQTLEDAVNTAKGVPPGPAVSAGTGVSAAPVKPA